MQRPFTVSKNGKNVVGPAPALHLLRRSSLIGLLKDNAFVGWLASSGKRWSILPYICRLLHCRFITYKRFKRIFCNTCKYGSVTVARSLHRIYQSNSSPLIIPVFHLARMIISYVSCLWLVFHWGLIDEDLEMVCAQWLEMIIGIINADTQTHYMYITSVLTGWLYSLEMQILYRLCLPLEYIWWYHTCMYSRKLKTSTCHRFPLIYAINSAKRVMFMTCISKTNMVSESVVGLFRVQAHRRLFWGGAWRAYS